MKFPLPGSRKPRKAAKKPAAQSSRAPGPAQSASLARVRIQLMFAGILLLAALAYVLFQVMALYIVTAKDQETVTTTDLLAARVAAMADYYGTSAALLAKDPEIADILMIGTAAERSAREESLRYVFPTAINVRLLSPGITMVDPRASPPLSYSALAQMGAAEAGDEPPPVEVHLFNTPQQHVNIVRKVMDPAGTGVIGHIMLSLSNDVLQGILDDLKELHGYIELRQAGEKGAPVVVAARGDPSIKSGQAERVVPIEHTRWQIAWWPETGSLAYLSGISFWVIGALLTTALLFAALVNVLFRRLFNALRQDEVTIVTLMKDFRDGRVRRDEGGGLAELQSTIDFMVQLAASAREPGGQRGQARRKDDRDDSAPYETPAAGISVEEHAEYPSAGAANFTSAISSDNLIVEEGPLNIAAVTGIDPSIFRAYDIRGVVDKTLTVEAVYLIGRAIGSEALQRGRNEIVVARDGRLSGPILVDALVEGITSTGCDVKDIGCVPTPVLYFATYYLDTQSGVVVTGSHNPPDYNGLKIVIDGETLSGNSIQDLRERIEAGNFISGAGSVETINVIPDYIERIRGDVSLARPLRVVIDCGNGVAGAVAPDLLRSLGCTLTELYCDVDGNFPNHHPDPSKTANLTDLINAVRTGHADIGLAFDGDGDRLGVVAADGTIIWPDRVLMLYAMDILERNPGGQIIYDVKCTRHLDKIIHDHGGEPLMWKTGHSFIKAKIRESGALLAGEMSGHIFIKERWYGFDDGLYAAARLLEILGKDMRSSTEVFAELPDSINTPELNVPMREGEPQQFIGRLLENAHFENATVSTIDGLRVDFEDGWGLVRASNTTPVLVLRFEADTEAALVRIMEDFRRAMLQVKSDLSLPF
ncbi:MAG: phosphomannomutase/phosphoglucomutase [Gammaproteobacteria bacterium]